MQEQHAMKCSIINLHLSLDAVITDCELHRIAHICEWIEHGA